MARLQRFAFSVALIARAAALSASKNAIAAHTNFVNSAGTGTGAASGDAAKHLAQRACPQLSMFSSENG